MIFEHFLSVGSYIAGLVTALFVLSIIIKRNDIADIAWGAGIFLVAVLSLELGVMDDGRLALAVLAGLWGVRLATRIFLRNIKKSEDPRYKVWRDSWGAWFYPRSYAQVYLLQGFLMLVVGYPFIHMSVYGGPDTSSVFFAVGLGIWLIGYVFEVVGDWQLDRFIKSKPPKDAVFTSGLWRYSRHPNYFGEVTMWWGIWVTLIGVSQFWLALISPLMITYLILKVSGIPMLERRYEHNEAFQAYKKTTSAFFPLPPKRQAGGE